MALISLGKINKKIFIPILGGVLRLIYKFIVYENPKITIFSNNPFLLAIYTTIGMILAFIPYLILKNQIKRKSINININNNENSSSVKTQKSKLEIEFEHYDLYEETKSSKYKLILIATIFDCLQTLSIFIFCFYCAYNLWIFDIILISLFSKLILKTILYKHQYFSMIIIIILGLGLNIIEYFKKDKNNNNKVDPIEIIFKIISEICFCLNVVTNKLNMEKYFCNSYEICIWEGLIDLIVISFILLIINIIGVTISGINYPQNFYEYIDQFDISDLFLVLLTIIINGLYNMSLIITNDIFTPCHVLIVLFINELYYYFQLKENLMLNILGLFVLILLFFMFLFFIEVFELNFFGLSKNTKKNIEKRSDSDTEIVTNIKDLDTLDIENENDMNIELNKL